MKKVTKQLLVAARRSILLGLSAALAVSAAAAEPAGIHYSDFIKYGEPAHAPLTGGEDFNAAIFSPVLTAAEPAGTVPWGVYLGVTGLVAAVAAVAVILDNQGDSSSSVTPSVPAMPTCADGGISDAKPTFSRAASRVYEDGGGDLSGSMDGNFNAAIPLTGVQGGLLSYLVGRRNIAKDGFNGRSFATNSFKLFDDVSAQVDPMAGDAVRAGTDTDDSSLNLRNAREYRIYSDGSDLFFAEGASYDNNADYEAGRGMVDGVLQCSIADNSERFFLDSSFAITRNFAEGVEQGDLPFALRTAWRGLMSGQALRIGSFVFSQNDNLRNTHIEHQATAFAAGAFALHTDGGWRRFDSGNSTMTYAKTTATWDLNPAVQLYAQNTGGWLNSSEYANGRLQAQAFGVFADKVLRHDDSYHLRLESPLADSRAQIWRLAADTSIGTVSDYLRLGLHHQVGGNKAGMRMFYSREF